MKHSKVLQEDLDSFTLPEDMLSELMGKRIVVTGATGLIGGAIVRTLQALRLGIDWVLPVRSEAKAKKIFGHEISESREKEGYGEIEIEECDVTEFFKNLKEPVDYIIHCASPTSGKEMTKHPSETFLLPIESEKAILEYGRRENVKGVVYLSSIEVYGEIHHREKIYEDSIGFIDRNSPRSSYALGKLSAEYLNYGYAEEYGIRAMNARLTQTFGAGISETENRVFAQFAKSALRGEDIILKTEGKSAKPYIYLTDCVSAIIYILLRGKGGESYNVSTPGTFLTIRELAEIYRKVVNPEIYIKIEKEENSGYAPDTTVNLDPTKLISLGWKWKYGIEEMVKRLASDMKEASWFGKS